MPLRVVCDPPYCTPPLLATFKVLLSAGNTKGGSITVS